MTDTDFRDIYILYAGKYDDRAAIGVFASLESAQTAWASTCGSWERNRFISLGECDYCSADIEQFRLDDLEHVIPALSEANRLHRSPEAIARARRERAEHKAHAPREFVGTATPVAASVTTLGSMARLLDDRVD